MFLDLTASFSLLRSLLDDAAGSSKHHNERRNQVEIWFGTDQPRAASCPRFGNCEENKTPNTEQAMPNRRQPASGATASPFRFRIPLQPIHSLKLLEASWNNPQDPQERQ